MKHRGIFETEVARDAFIAGKPKEYKACVRIVKAVDTGKVMYSVYLNRPWLTARRELKRKEREFRRRIADHEKRLKALERRVKKR